MTSSKMLNIINLQVQKNKTEKEVITIGKYSEYVQTEEIKKTRLSKKLSCRDMAKLMGVKSQATYFNIENGIVEPKISQMIKISSILKRPVSKFFTVKVQKTKTMEAKR